MAGHTYAFSSNSLVVTDNNAKISTIGSEYQYFDFQAIDLQRLYHDIADLLNHTFQIPFYPEPVQEITANEDVCRVIRLLANSPAALLRFIYVYCLGHNRDYFSALLHQYTAADQPFLAFIEENFLNPWPVTRFAEEFNMPLRKFNLLFQEKFGTSAKHWLLVRRLEHAYKLLKSNKMRVLDIAMECGFSNHAHFTGSFRKHFNCSPSDVRQESIAEKATINRRGDMLYPRPASL